ncbi:MAG: phosphate ABC transporter ATP-binding protein, partial [Alphaproteobacteria bacterium]
MSTQAMSAGAAPRASYDTTPTKVLGKDVCVFYGEKQALF